VIRFSSGHLAEGAVVRAEATSLPQDSLLPVPTAEYTGRDGAYRFSLFPATYRIYVYVEVSGEYRRGEQTGVRVSRGKSAVVDILIEER
jgi:hypothetical protein